MHRSRLFLVLVGLTISLTVVTGALAAAMIFDDHGDKPESGVPNIAGVSTPTQIPSPTAEAEQPDGIPDDVWADLKALPAKLHNDLIARFEAGGLAVSQIETVIEEYEGRNRGVRVGTVLEATGSTLRLEVYTTGEHAEVALDDDTVLRRGHDDITAADLEQDELVMVISRDGGLTAFSVTAFGVGAP